MQLYSQVIGNSTLYDLGTKLARFSNLLPRVGPLKEWQNDRELPVPSKERFRDWFKKTFKIMEIK